MDKVVNDPPSPGPIDNSGTKTLLTTINANVTPALAKASKSSIVTLEPYNASDPNDNGSSIDLSINKASGHQGAKVTGGNDNRVLVCANLLTSIDYEEIFDELKVFGPIKRIKLKLTKSKRFISYTTFLESADALSAYTALTDGKLNFQVKCSLMNPKNLMDEENDFIPADSSTASAVSSIERENPIPIWHVAFYKPGRENMIRASEAIQRKVGNLCQGNLKRYGKALLIKAGNDTQGMLLSNFKPSEDGNIKSISPHSTFNNPKGIIFSKDLMDFTEEEILEKCPPSVLKVKKFEGENNAIMLVFSRFVPDYIYIELCRIKVKPFQQRPTQCFSCFEYGHVSDKCNNQSKCINCSEEHELPEFCPNQKYCFHCGGDHSPNARMCPRYKFEQEILAVANNEYISIGNAKRIVMGANRSPDSTYAKIISKMNINRINRRVNNPSSATRIPETPNPPSLNEHDEARSQKEKSEFPSKAENVQKGPRISRHRNPSSQSKTTEDKNKKGKGATPKKIIQVETETSIITLAKRPNRVEDDSEVSKPPKKIKQKSSENIVEMVEVNNSFSALESVDGEALLSEAACPQEHSEDLPPSLPDLSEGIDSKDQQLPQRKPAIKSASSVPEGKTIPSHIPKPSHTGTKLKRPNKNLNGPQRNQGSPSAHSSGK